MGSVLAVVVVVVVAAKTFRVGRIKTWKIHVTKSVYLAHTQTTHTHRHECTPTQTQTHSLTWVFSSMQVFFMLSDWQMG